MLTRASLLTTGYYFISLRKDLERPRSLLESDQLLTYKIAHSTDWDPDHARVLEGVKPFKTVAGYDFRKLPCAPANETRTSAPVTTHKCPTSPIAKSSGLPRQRAHLPPTPTSHPFQDQTRRKRRHQEENISPGPASGIERLRQAFNSLPRG